MRDCTFRVRINGLLSTFRSTPIEVPQGGAFSLTLLNIYESDVPMLIERTGVSCEMLADDVMIFSRVADGNDT